VSDAAEIKRLKRRVNKLISERRKLKEELELTGTLSPEESYVITEAMWLISQEHDEIHHWGTCKTCRALQIMKEQFPDHIDDSLLPDHERWRYVNRIGTAA
jgi:hypothetical protein